ncbi:MAG: hypothetical protein V4709_00160 [Pseudomonadota bacterium]
MGEIVEWPGASAERKALINAEAARRLAIIRSLSTIPDGLT